MDGEIEPAAWENYYISQGYKLTATWHVRDVDSINWVQRRRPEPTMTNWGNASKTCTNMPQDTAEHNRRELVTFCQGCWHFIDFRHNKGTIAALELMTNLRLKIDAYRPASGTQGRLRGAITSQEIARYVEYCLIPGKTPGLGKCPNVPMSYSRQCQMRNS